MLLPRYSDITHGLTQRPARISPKYFYDQHGSRLFEAITRLPEYYPTRTEMALMQAHADSIAHAIGPGRTLIELGAGNCQKARTLCRLVQPACFVGVDISADFLERAVQGLRDEFPALDARALAGDMTLGVSLPDDIPRTGRLVFYPGSSIGNFDPPHALDLLAHMRELVDDDGALLIGIDLPKDVAVLEAAYDDAAGVTAEFNRNVLRHVNRLIGSDFDVAQWTARSSTPRRRASRCTWRRPLTPRYAGPAAVAGSTGVSASTPRTATSTRCPCSPTCSRAPVLHRPRRGRTSGAGLQWSTPVLDRWYS